MSHHLSILGSQGQEISVVAAGEGPALMLVHGFPLDHRLWLSQLEYFSASRHVIAPELRGFGKSPLGTSPYSLALLADDLEFVRQRLAGNRSMVLCGLSMGGYVAFEYAAKYGQYLAGLVLANTKPGIDAEVARAGRRAMAETASRSGTQVALRGMQEKLLAPMAQASVKETARQIMESVAAETIVAAQLSMLERRDFTHWLDQFQCSTLVVTGSDDVLCPPDETEHWASQIPNSVFQVVESAGHLSPIEQPDAFNQIVERFVREIEST